MSGPTTADGPPFREHELARPGNAASVPFSAASNTASGLAPSSGLAGPPPGHLGAPAFALGLHLRQRGEFPAPPE